MTEPVSAYVAVGSNIDPRRNVPWALTLLQARVTVTALSTFYRSVAVGPSHQPPFVNGVVRCETAMAPRAFKYNVLREVEREVGRVRTDDKYAPRCIDLDLVLYGTMIVHEEGLELPDPEIWNRPFLAVPLLELWPGCTVPGSGVPLAESPVTARAGEMTPDHALTRLIKDTLRR